MTDEQKLQETKMAFTSKIDSINDWNTFKTILSNLTKDKIKTFIKGNLQNLQQSHVESANSATETASNLEDLITEVDQI